MWDLEQNELFVHCESGVGGSTRIQYSICGLSCVRSWKNKQTKRQDI